MDFEWSSTGNKAIDLESHVLVVQSTAPETTEKGLTQNTLTTFLHCYTVQARSPANVNAGYEN
jgi:hypothetical protein